MPPKAEQPYEEDNEFYDEEDDEEFEDEEEYTDDDEEDYDEDEDDKDGPQDKTNQQLLKDFYENEQPDEDEEDEEHVAAADDKGVTAGATGNATITNGAPKPDEATKEPDEAAGKPTTENGSKRKAEDEPAAGAKGSTEAVGEVNGKSTDVDGAEAKRAKVS